MTKKFHIVYLYLFSLALFSCQQEKIEKPNILILYADDLGFGDIAINGARGVATPNIDELAKNGINFTDAHCTAATCTPSRYSLLTGQYAFRNNANILAGDAGMIIDPKKETLPKMLQRAGYKTGVVGKWHLGLGEGNVDWNRRIAPGPNEIGFDYSYIIPATGDRVPCVFVENGSVVNLSPEDPLFVSYENDLGDYPNGRNDEELLKIRPSGGHNNSIINGISRIGFMKGGHEALWDDEKIPDELTEKAKQFIHNSKENPFFLYLAYHDIHVPRIPASQFKNKSTMGARGDVIAQLDWYVGELIDFLKKENLYSNTLIIFSSDNGPILDDGYIDGAEKLVDNHKPAGMFSGGKYSMYEGGTRVPTIVSWPKRIEKGLVSQALLSQVDLLTSLANLVGQPVVNKNDLDSENYILSWLGESEKGRDVLLEEGFSLAIRKLDWKYIAPYEYDKPDWLKLKNIDDGLEKNAQLYHLSSDVAEKTNMAHLQPEIVKDFQFILDEIINKK